MNKHLMAVALAAAAAAAAPAHATTINLAADGNWNEFDVSTFADPLYSSGWIDNVDGSALTFTFTIAAGQVGMLTVVDAGYAGDTFTVTNFGSAIGTTSSVPVGVYDGSDPQLDFDAALGNPAFSRGIFQLQAGSYSISGALLQSVKLDDGSDVGATIGGVNLALLSVPEAPGSTLMLGGLAVLAAIARRRTSTTV